MPKTSVLVLSLGLAVLFHAPAARPATWRPIGPEGGDVFALAFAPSDSRVAYAGIFEGGFFRSGDGGSSWTAMSSPAPGLYSLAVDPRDSAIVYAGTSRGLYETTAGGASWRLLPLPSNPPRQVTAVRVAPALPRILYAATIGREIEVYRSADGGGHWARRDAGLPLAFGNERLQALDVDPDAPNTLYAGFYDGNLPPRGVPPLYKTTNGGGSWTAVTSLPAIQVYDLARQRSTDTLYAATSEGLFATRDGGATWTRLYEGTLEHLAVTPSGTLYGNLLFSGIFSSADGGRTWKDPAPSSPDFPHGPPFALAPAPAGDRLLAGTFGTGIYALDAGGSWTQANRGLRAAVVQGLVVSPARPSRLSVALSGGGVLVSDDGGASFSARNTGIPPDLPPREIFTFGLAGDPRAPDALVVGFASGMAQTFDAGLHWTSEDPICELPDTLALAPPATIFVASTFAFRGNSCARSVPCTAKVSRDGGASFACLGGVRDASALLVDPLRPAVVYAAAGNSLWKSADRGLHFAPLASDLGMMVTALATSPAARQTLYAAGDKGVLKSTDGGAHWSPVGRGLDSGTTLVVDPADPAIVYATGLQADPAGYRYYGVFASRDGGASWKALGDGLPSGIDVMRLALDRSRHVLYAGTYGSGVWALTLP